MRLEFGGPLDWDLLLGYFATRAIAGVEQVDLVASTYRRTVVVAGEARVLTLSRAAPGALHVDLDPPPVSVTADVVARARGIFALDRDPTEAAAHLAADPVLAPLVAARPGLRVPGTWDPYETGVRAIVGQQVSVAGASTVTARIVQRVGTPVPKWDGHGLTHTFPAPPALAAADLAGIGMPGERAEAIRAFAAAVDSGEVVLDGSVGLDELIASICRIRGLGPWTASYIALRMGESDAFPAADLGLRRAVRPAAPLTTAELAARAEAWRPWRGQAAVRLWLS